MGGVGDQRFLAVLLAQPSHLQWPQLSLQNVLSLCLVFCCGQRTTEELPGLEREQPSPAPLSAAYDLRRQVSSNFIEGNNSPICCKKYCEEGLQLEVPEPCGDWAVGNIPVYAAGQLLHMTGLRHADRQLLVALMCERKEKTAGKFGMSPDSMVLSITGCSSPCKCFTDRRKW